MNETYIRMVRTMSPEKRHAIAAGKDSTGLSALVHASNLPLLPKPTANRKLDDNTLFAVVHEVGIDKILAVAAQVETDHQAH